MQGRKTMDPNSALDLLGTPQLWIVLAVAFVLGAAGAALHRWSAPNDDNPPLLRDILSGGIAAVAILYVTNPSSGVAFVGGALVAGYAAKAVLAALQARVVAAIATRELAERTREISESRREIDDTRRKLGRLAESVAALSNTGSSQPAPSDLATVKQLAHVLDPARVSQ